MARTARSRRPVIRRDRTFTYQGQAYRVLQGSDRPSREGWGYFVVRESDGRTVTADSFFYLSEVRDWLAEHAKNGTPLDDDAV